MYNACPRMNGILCSEQRSASQYQVKMRSTPTTKPLVFAGEANIVSTKRKVRSADDYHLLIDLHKRANRQGPGGESETEKAISLAMIDRDAPLKIADMGCGTGASALLLARLLKAGPRSWDFLKK